MSRREALRVLIASDFYPPFIGGLERQSAMEARELAARGHEVTVATIWHPGLPETETDQGVRISRLKDARSRWKRANRGSSSIESIEIVPEDK